MVTTTRRYDIDWIRVIAIGLLLTYHVAIGFQRWGIMIGFITNEKPWESLWIPMTMLNVWRIPLLFFVSGMGVYFAIQNRNWKQLLLERARRILLPFVFGMFVIVPVHVYLWSNYYHWDVKYSPNPGHLWFLGNIFLYVVILMPVFFYFTKHEDGVIVRGIKKVLRYPLGLLLVVALFAIEALIINPAPYELYAMTWHGFFLGLLAFFAGFCFVMSGDSFWKMLLLWRWVFLAAAVFLFTLRLIQYPQPAPSYLLSIESNFWIFAVFAFGYRYLNYPSIALDYLAQAAYPVYILHMIVLSAASSVLFKLDMPVQLQFISILLSTVVGCFALYELVVRRVNILRPLFGLKMKERSRPAKKETLLRTIS